MNFVETLEYRRFVEFCEACCRYQYIGLCYGPSGVGKTLSSRRYTRWDDVETANWRRYPDGSLRELRSLHTVLYTPAVINTPRLIEHDLATWRAHLKRLALEPLRREEESELEAIRVRDEAHVPNAFTTHDWSKALPKLRPTYAQVSHRYAAAQKVIGDPTKLIVVDESDRLRIASLEQLRAVFDAGGIGLILVGMPGVEKRLAGYPQFCSRVGFVHEFRPLSAKETNRLLMRGWCPAGVTLPEMNSETVAAIVRTTGGNFRLLNRVLTQMERIAKINGLDRLNKNVVETARQSLVIGQL
jgi:DNA transposition AAA+ family ATPase